MALDAASEQFVQTKVNGMDGMWNQMTGADKVAAEKFADYINNQDVNVREREDALKAATQKAAELHLPTLTFTGGEDTDGNGQVDRIKGVMLGSKVLYDANKKR